MKLLSSYNEYIVELKIIEALRTFPLFLSKRLRDKLSQINHEIATELLAKHSDLDTKVKQTFLDVHPDKPDYITFIQPNKASQVLGWEIAEDSELVDKIKSEINTLNNISDDDDVFKRFRGETKWGRFLQAVFPGKYQLSLGGGQNRKDIESFVNLYKSLNTKETLFPLLDIVKGSDISYWYNCDNYHDEEDGSLGDSCMKSVPNDYFDIYTKNTDKVSLVIMYTNDSKSTICARAILWKLDEPGNRIFMDRVYTNNYSHEQTFIDFAIHNNWLYKESQSMGAELSITDPENDHTEHITLMAKLKPVNYDNYPYCDTMTFYNPHTGIISNKDNFNPKYEMTDTDGNPYEIDDYHDPDDYVYSEYHGSDILEEDAIWCGYGKDWVEKDVAIKVFNSGGENYAVPGNPNVVQSKFDIPGKGTYNKHFPEVKCVWSNYLDTWLFKGDTTGAKKVWADKQRNKSILDHSKRLNIAFKEVNGEYWLNQFVDDNGDLVNGIVAKIEKPIGTPPQGWHRRREYVDEAGNIFRRGVFSGTEEK